MTEPTDWVSSMVTVVKNGKVRICIDPKDLNKAVRRENFPIPIVEEVVASMPDAKVFSVIDAKSGFLQIKLNYESSLLTASDHIGQQKMNFQLLMALSTKA